jgi:outer membrane lipoprotein-sorting protein
MKIFKAAVMLTLVLLSVGAVQAQTAEEIANKYVEAIGGKEKLQGLKSVYMESTTNFMGTEGNSNISALFGVGYRMNSEMRGQPIVMVLTEKGGWQINPFMGATTPTALPEEMFKETKGRIDIFGPLNNYAAKGNKLELLGKDAGKYMIKVTTPDSATSTVYIDSATYYMTKVVTSATMMGQTMEVTTTNSDFKKEKEGIVFPHSIEISYNSQFNVTTTVNKIELNKQIDPSIFEMPKS